MVVDIVCDAGATWIMVIGRNPFSVDWKDTRGTAGRGLKHKLQELIIASEHQANPIRLLISFTRTPPVELTDRICDKLRGRRVWRLRHSTDPDAQPEFEDDNTDSTATTTTPTIEQEDHIDSEDGADGDDDDEYGNDNEFVEDECENWHRLVFYQIFSSKPPCTC